MGSASCAFSGEVGSLLPIFSFPALISHPDDTTRAVELGGAPHTAPSARLLLAVTGSIPAPWLQLPLGSSVARGPSGTARCPLSLHPGARSRAVGTAAVTPCRERAGIALLSHIGFGGCFGAVGRSLAEPICSLAGAQGCFSLTSAPLSQRSVSLKRFGIAARVGSVPPRGDGSWGMPPGRAAVPSDRAATCRQAGGSLWAELVIFGVFNSWGRVRGARRLSAAAGSCSPRPRLSGVPSVPGLAESSIPGARLPLCLHGEELCLS